MKNADCLPSPSPRVPLRAINETGMGGSVPSRAGSQENLLACITFCTRPAISCVMASFRAADCCSTRMALSRESCGKAGSTRGILAGVEP